MLCIYKRQFDCSLAVSTLPLFKAIKRERTKWLVFPQNNKAVVCMHV